MEVWERHQWRNEIPDWTAPALECYALSIARSRVMDLFRQVGRNRRHTYQMDAGWTNRVVDPRAHRQLEAQIELRRLRERIEYSHDRDLGLAARHCLDGRSYRDLALEAGLTEAHTRVRVGRGRLRRYALWNKDPLHIDGSKAPKKAGATTHRPWARLKRTGLKAGAAETDGTESGRD